MLKIYRRIIEITLAIIVIEGAVYHAWSSGLFGGKDDELKIEKTENVVTSIRQITELSTESYFEEFTVSKTKQGFLHNDKLVIIAQGKVRAGVNLKKLTDKDVAVSGDTLFLQLPKAELLDATINPSGFDVFIEDGKWSPTEVQTLKTSAVAVLKKNAVRAGILQKAQQSANLQITSLCKSLGYNTVICEDL